MIHALQTLLLLIFPLTVIVAALRDAMTFRISNRISLGLVLAFPIAGLAMGLPAEAFGIHLATGLAALAIGMGMFFAGWLGGGDGKLFAAAALWIGWPAGLTFVAITCIAGGALAVGLLTLRSPFVRPYVMNGPAWFTRLAEPGESVPYGLAIAVGALVAFPESDLVQALGRLG